jgi:hypothetical protein
MNPTKSTLLLHRPIRVHQQPTLFISSFAGFVLSFRKAGGLAQAQRTVKNQSLAEFFGSKA